MSYFHIVFMDGSGSFPIGSCFVEVEVDVDALLDEGNLKHQILMSKQALEEARLRCCNPGGEAAVRRLWRGLDGLIPEKYLNRLLNEEETDEALDFAVALRRSIESKAKSEPS